MSDTLPRNADHKTTTPHFFADPNTDRLMRMVMTLAAEVAVLRERLDTHERVAEAKRLYGAADIEAYTPDDATQAARDAWRERFLDRLIALMGETLEPGR